MRLAVCLYKFFPFGGLSRDFVRIMDALLTTEDTVDVFCIEWQGDVPPQFNITLISAKGYSNHSKLMSFQCQLMPYLQSGAYDLVLGFNKMPGLDLYYAADPCYIDRLKSYRLYPLLRFSPRVRFYSACEQAVFGTESDTVSLMISDVQQALFKQHYGTPDSRLLALPPGIDPQRRRPDNAAAIRQHKRKELGIEDDEWLLLMVGTGFKTKGVDRSIAAVSQLADNYKKQVRLLIAGDGDSQKWRTQAKNSGVDRQLTFLGGRSDITELLLAADLLLHPARKENTGTVILEAMVAGLPVLVSDVCGYAKYVITADAGLLLDRPDDAERMARQIETMLEPKRLKYWSEQALQYAAVEDLYSMPEKAAQVIRRMAQEKRG